MEQENNQQEADKIEKKFTSTLKRIAAILNGEEKLRLTNKVDQSELNEIVEELFKEERDKNKENLKKQLKELLQSYAKYQQEVKEKQNEFDKLKKQKMEEFNKAANNVFNLIINLGEKEKTYFEGLSQASKAADEGAVPV